MDYYTPYYSEGYGYFHDYVTRYFPRQDYPTFSSYCSYNSSSMANPGYEPFSVHNNWYQSHAPQPPVETITRGLVWSETVDSKAVFGGFHEPTNYQSQSQPLIKKTPTNNLEEADEDSLIALEKKMLKMLDEMEARTSKLVSTIGKFNQRWYTPVTRVKEKIEIGDGFEEVDSKIASVEEEPKPDELQMFDKMPEPGYDAPIEEFSIDGEVISKEGSKLEEHRLIDEISESIIRNGQTQMFKAIAEANLLGTRLRDKWYLSFSRKPKLKGILEANTILGGSLTSDDVYLGPSIDIWGADNLRCNKEIGGGRWCISVDTTRKWECALANQKQKLLSCSGGNSKGFEPAVSQVQFMIIEGAEVGFHSVFFDRIDYRDGTRQKNEKSLEFIWQISENLVSYAHIFASLKVTIEEDSDDVHALLGQECIFFFCCSLLEFASSDYTPLFRGYASGIRISTKSMEEGCSSPNLELSMQPKQPLCILIISLNACEGQNSKEINVLGLEYDQEKESYVMMKKRERRQDHLDSCLVTYGALVNGLCRGGYLNREHELLREIQLPFEFTPNVVTFTILLDIHCRLGEVDHLASIGCEWAEMELRHKSFRGVLELNAESSTEVKRRVVVDGSAMILIRKARKTKRAGKYNHILKSGKDFVKLVGAHNEDLSAIESLNGKLTADAEEISSFVVHKQESGTGGNEKVDNDKETLEQLIQEEESNTGNVVLYVYTIYLDTFAVTTFVYWSAHTFAVVVIFGACMLMRISPESGKILSSLATLITFQEPIYNLSAAISLIVQPKVFVDRILPFFSYDDPQRIAVNMNGDGSRYHNNYKIIYAAPMKALVADVVENLSNRLEQYGVRVKGLHKVNGDIEFKNIMLSYSSRLDVLSFNKFFLNIHPDKIVALSGGSGSGKSTVIFLIGCFYEPISRHILLDGTDSRKLDYKWLRQQIGLVNQEPALFATTVRENILYGKNDATIEEITSAAKLWETINCVSNLLRLEATSAVDAKSEPKGNDEELHEYSLQLLESFLLRCPRDIYSKYCSWEVGRAEAKWRPRMRPPPEPPPIYQASTFTVILVPFSHTSLEDKTLLRGKEYYE